MPRRSTKTRAQEPARLDEKALLSRITIEPGVCGGRPCIRNTRVRVIDVLELLASGMTPRQIVRQLPYLELADVSASLEFAARSMDHSRLVA